MPARPPEPTFARYLADVGTTSSASFRRRWPLWLAFAVASLLLHLVIFSSRPWSWAPIRPPNVEVRSIDPRELDRIRRQWKEDGKFALSKDTPESAEAPEDARFISDRNRRVEREQRARNTAVKPVPGDASRTGQTDPAEKSRARGRVGDKPLSDLGVPFDLNKKAPAEGDATSDEERAAQVGADQYIDEDLAEGDQNVLNTKESVFYSFYARIYDRAGAFWNSLVNGMQLPQGTPAGEYITVAEVVMNDQGDIIHVELVKRSGLEPLDEVVREVWRKVKKVPNPPKGLLDNKRQVTLRWTFRLDLSGGAGLRFLPPRRVR